MNDSIIELKEKILDKIYEFAHDLIRMKESKESSGATYSCATDVSYYHGYLPEEHSSDYRYDNINGITIEMWLGQEKNLPYTDYSYYVLNVRLNNGRATIECEFDNNIDNLVEGLVKYHLSNV